MFPYFSMWHGRVGSKGRFKETHSHQNIFKSRQEGYFFWVAGIYQSISSIQTLVLALDKNLFTMRYSSKIRSLIWKELLFSWSSLKKDSGIPKFLALVFCFTHIQPIYIINKKVPSSSSPSRADPPQLFGRLRGVWSQYQLFLWGKNLSFARAQGLAFFQSMGLAHGDLKLLRRNLSEISLWSHFCNGKLGQCWWDWCFKWKIYSDMKWTDIRSVTYGFCICIYFYTRKSPQMWFYHIYTMDGVGLDFRVYHFSGLIRKLVHRFFGFVQISCWICLSSGIRADVTEWLSPWFF